MKLQGNLLPRRHLQVKQQVWLLSVSDKNGTPITAGYPGYTYFKDSESGGPKGQPIRNTNIWSGKATINGKEILVEVDENS